MEQQQYPQTVGEYFSLQFRKLGNWLKPDPKDHMALIIIKSILKSIVVLILIMLSPVLILGLTIAFIGTF